MFLLSLNLSSSMSVQSIKDDGNNVMAGSSQTLRGLVASNLISSISNSTCEKYEYPTKRWCRDLLKLHGWWGSWGQASAISNITSGMRVSKPPWTISLTQLPFEIHHVTPLDNLEKPSKNVTWILDQQNHIMW